VKVGDKLIKPLKILSLFDGISCGRLALNLAGIPIDEYAAFEIDKYAIAISGFNYPDIRQHGDVMAADFSLFKGFDMVIGGSPCAFWSCAKGGGREVDKAGIGWLLFSKFVEAVRIVRPKWFFYENVASMPATIKRYISEEFGAEPIAITSALVSAQQRKRLYWTNIPGVEQPEDKGILLQDILGSGLSATEKSYCLTARYGGAEIRNTLERKQKSMVFEPIAKICSPNKICDIGRGGQGYQVYSVRGKSVCLSANGGGLGGTTGLYKVDLPDGDYIVRKLTPVEAERCQTLPDGYTAFGIGTDGKPVKISNAQRYKCIGNGWTAEIIAHIFSYML
jgi:DNA (cytosine-5)-methyltransferase 3A